MNIQEYINKYSKIYFDDCKTSGDLETARKNKTMFYRGKCQKHGNVVLYTKDNNCPICHKINREKRYSKNKDFMRGQRTISKLKQRATKKNIPFDLNPTKLRAKVSKQKFCPVFGVPISYGDKTHSDLSISIDRIDSKAGYTEDNICIMSNRANRIKSDGTAIEHLLIVRWQLEQNKDKLFLIKQLDDILENL